jgi:hypothetical protein
MDFNPGKLIHVENPIEILANPVISTSGLILTNPDLILINPDKKCPKCLKTITNLNPHICQVKVEAGRPYCQLCKVYFRIQVIEYLLNTFRIKTFKSIWFNEMSFKSFTKV